jgi:hypothetical protein
MNKKKTTTIEDEQEGREGEQCLLVILTKYKKKGVAIATNENEQRIEERSSSNYK